MHKLSQNVKVGDTIEIRNGYRGLEKFLVTGFRFSPKGHLINYKLDGSINYRVHTDSYVYVCN